MKEPRVPFEFKGFVNVYEDGHLAIHHSQAKADASATSPRIACIPVVVTGMRGDGLPDA